jgi:hypothetical protein
MKPFLEKMYEDNLDMFGYPQKYKDLFLYPIMLKDIRIQNLFYKLLANPKMYIADAQILKTSYLKFIIYVIYPNSNLGGEQAIADITEFLEYITREKISFSYKETGKQGLEFVDIKIIVGDKEYTERDFDNIREIILQQNGLSIEYIEEYDPTLEESLRWMNRQSNDLTLQDEIFTFSVLMKMPIKEIELYTLYQFHTSFEKLLTLKEFELYKPPLITGEITLKSGEVKHFLYHSDRGGRYDSIKIDPNAFMNMFHEPTADEINRQNK